MVWQAVVDELAQVVANVIPNAVETEGKFWSLSDAPSTGGGRFATLNVGMLQFAYFPRRKQVAGVGTLEGSNGLVWWLNAQEETFIPRGKGYWIFRRPRPFSRTGQVRGMPVEFARHPRRYFVPVDAVRMPLGALGASRLQPEKLEGARRLAIHTMRAGHLGANQRFHSPALTRLVYQRIVERDRHVAGHSLFSRR